MRREGPGKTDVRKILLPIFGIVRMIDTIVFNVYDPRTMSSPPHSFRQARGRAQLS